MASSDLVLVTGATGFIGFRTLVLTLKAGYRVRSAIRSLSKADTIKENPVIKSLNLSPDTLTFVEVPDITAPGAFDEAVKDVKYIIHVASPLSRSLKPGDDQYKGLVEPAVKGTLGVFESAKKSAVKRIVVTSSIVALMEHRYMASEASPEVVSSESRTNYPPQPWNSPFLGYAASKVAALNEAEAWVKKEKPSFDVISIHPSYVHGRNDLALTPEEAFFSTNLAILNVAVGGKYSDPRKSGTGVHVDDVARIHVESLNPKISGNQSFLLAVPIVWDQIPKIVAKHYPDAVKAGLVSSEGEQKSIPILLDVWKTEETFGKLQGFEEQVTSIVGQYLELKAAA